MTLAAILAAVLDEAGRVLWTGTATDAGTIAQPDLEAAARDASIGYGVYDFAAR